MVIKGEICFEMKCEIKCLTAIAQRQEDSLRRKFVLTVRI